MCFSTGTTQTHGQNLVKIAAGNENPRQYTPERDRVVEIYYCRFNPFFYGADEKSAC
jgi:hypothetical protein